MIITETFRALVAELAEEGLPDPLTRPMALFAVWADACRIAGEPEPPEVAALMDAPAATLLQPSAAAPTPARFIPVPKPRPVRR